MSTEKIRIRIKAYDHRILDNAAKKIVETVKRSGGNISGPVPLPTEIEKFTILRAVHKYKDSMIVCFNSYTNFFCCHSYCIFVS